MASEPKIELYGLVGAEPSSYTFSDGSSSTSFSLAVTPSNKQPDGSYKSRDTQWYRVKAVGNEAIGQLPNVHKGIRLHIQGALTSIRPYVTKQNTAAASISVSARMIEVIPTRQQETQFRQKYQQPQQQLTQQPPLSSDPWSEEPEF